MALKDLLYRCPVCGHDSTTGKKTTARCPACGREFEWLGPDGIEVRLGSGAVEGVHHPAELVDRIREHGGPLTAAQTEEGLEYRAPADYHGPVTEQPLRIKDGPLLGYVENPGASVPGLLTLSADRLSFRAEGRVSVPRGGATVTDDGRLEWSLDQITSLQVASGALQIGIRGEGTIEIGLRDDSPFRWEELLQHVLRRRWEEAGRGGIVEFQPRIETA